MYASLIDLSESARRASSALLQQRLFDAVDLASQVRQAHWNVKGANFISLHELFDRLHGEVDAFVDLFAERITALGGVADGRVGVVAAKSKLLEYPLEAQTAVEHLTAVATAIGAFAKAVRGDIASSTCDADTADIFTEVSRALDKQLWLVEAHLT